MNIQQAIDHLKRYPPDTPCALALWLPDDIINRAKEQDCPVPDDDECAFILTAMNDRQDANDGITWYTIDHYLERKEA